MPEKEKKPQEPKPEKKKDNRSAYVGNIMKEARKWIGSSRQLVAPKERQKKSIYYISTVNVKRKFRLGMG